ncbi:MAG: hypothetical protein DRI70_03330 [Bacteroidetes bacterium]|nr:MAG: hypothetical protein DRI70_03330 [Bacteroidota bacterium]
MKKVVLILSVAVLTTVFYSCKNEKTTEIVNDTPETEVIGTSEDLALVNSEEIDAEAKAEYLFVTAISGLSLREYSNLQSQKLARMPYGTKVKVISTEKNATMNISGIKGGMNEVEFNHKKGYAFNGYLSKYFPPEHDISVKGYAIELNRIFPEVVFTESSGGTASNPSNTETIVLPEARWNEAFFMAQRLFDFPKEFDFPNPKGKNIQTITDGKPKRGVWVSQLEITRKNNELEKIEYVYKSKKFDSKVTIVKQSGAMKISKTEVVK